MKNTAICLKTTTAQHDDGGNQADFSVSFGADGSRQANRTKLFGEDQRDTWLESKAQLGFPAANR